MDRAVTIAELGDLQAIRNVLASHSRGLDRADAGLLSACYHGDATVDYGFFAGPAGDFAVIIVGAQSAGPVTLHRTAQMWIEPNGDRARSESYVMAYAAGPDEDGAMFQRLICGRYLDRHERRDGEWRLSHRTYVLDTSANWPGAFVPPVLGQLAQHVPVGGHGARDAGVAALALAKARNRRIGKEGQAMTTPNHGSAKLDAIIARQEIADLTMAYCRGVDRADAPLLASIFHDDSTVVSGPYNGDGKAFAAEICRLVEETYEQTFHSIANQWFEVDGDGAIGESYVIAIATSRGTERTDTLTGGRYIDRFERREGAWKIAERSFVLDWARAEPSTRRVDGGMYDSLELQGRRGREDPVYAFMCD